MASIVKVKNPNGTTYIYENITVWNKDRKIYEHKRNIIGKITKDGEEIMYDKKPSHFLKPVFSKNYGNTYFLDQISNAIGLKNILVDLFQDDYDVLITLVHYIVCMDSSLSNTPKWMELTNTVLKTELSSQYISSFIKSISDEIILNFFKRWVSKRLESEYIAFDITSISSYSELIELVEMGYNRDKEKLPQINMGMFFGESSLLPIFYNLYPGSIKDVKTLSNMLTYCDVLNVKKIKFVMDKGFYSDTNITEMIKKKKKFTIAIPFKSAIATSKVNLVKDTIKKPSKIIAIDELVYGEVIKDKWEYIDDGKIKQSTIYYHVIYDDDKRNEIENRVMNKVQKLKNELDEYIRIYNRLPKNIEKYEQYLKISKSKGKYISTIIDEVIEKELLYEGYMVVISNDLKEVNDVFYTYRRKDVVEKAFDNLKNDLDVKRLKVHNTRSLKGKMFIAFLALILKTSIYNEIINNGNICKYSANDILKEMQKISIINFENGVSMLTEISSTQKKILRAFKINEPHI